MPPSASANGSPSAPARRRRAVANAATGNGGDSTSGSKRPDAGGPSGPGKGGRSPGTRSCHAPPRLASSTGGSSSTAPNG